MNKKLKFAWGHIIAFLALIAVSYISFVGFTYLTNGNFTYAIISMSITDIVFLLFFIGAQQMKASGVKMRRKILWERIFIFGSPFVFIAGMVSMSHFWTVRAQNDEVVNNFTTAINSSKQLFDDYEAYAIKRIGSYDKMLDSIIANQDTQPNLFRQAGFEKGKAAIQKENMVETLRLQLLSKNYDSLKTLATQWVDDANKGASTWNVFLLGNTREIKDALKSWEDQLKGFSAKELSNEAIAQKVTHFQSDGAKNAIAKIDSMTSSFTVQKFPTLGAIIFGIAIYLMLLFPYFLQERHTKSVYRLIGTERNPKIKKHKPSKKITVTSEENQDCNTQKSKLLNLEEDNNYPTF